MKTKGQQSDGVSAILGNGSAAPCAPRGASTIFAALTRSEIVRDYEKSFTAATGLSLKLLPKEFPAEPIPFGAHQCPFCAMILQSPEGCARCAREHARVQDRAAESLEPQRVCCFAGMADVAVPVVVYGEHVATLFAGQVFLQKPTKQRFNRLVQQLLKWGVETDLASLREAYLHSRVIAAPEFRAMVRLLRIFAHHLARYAHECLLQRAGGEPPGVTRAKEFAQQHAAEQIAMPDAARYVHLSASYFCKMFRKSTGITFTEYVARVRVEKAKTLLLDINKRVCEIAFDSGFESIPHFNRVFKRYAGVAPTEYRASMRRNNASPPSP